MNMGIIACFFTLLFLYDRTDVSQAIIFKVYYIETSALDKFTYSLIIAVASYIPVEYYGISDFTRGSS